MPIRAMLASYSGTGLPRPLGFDPMLEANKRLARAVVPRLKRYQAAG